MTTLNTLILKSPEQTTKIKMAERGPAVLGRQSFAQMKNYSKARRASFFFRILNEAALGKDLNFPREI